MIKMAETKKLKSDDRTLYDETQKFEIGKVVVYQNEKTKVTDKKRDALPIKGINVAQSCFSKSVLVFLKFSLKKCKVGIFPLTLRYDGQ